MRCGTAAVRKQKGARAFTFMLKSLAVVRNGGADEERNTRAEAPASTLRT